VVMSCLYCMSMFVAFNNVLYSIATVVISTTYLFMGKFIDVILLEASFFMMLGSLPFFLFVREMHGQRGALFRDQQVRLFLLILLIVPALLTLYRWWVSTVAFGLVHRYIFVFFNGCTVLIY